MFSILEHHLKVRVQRKERSRHFTVLNFFQSAERFISMVSSDSVKDHWIDSILICSFTQLV